MFSAMRWTPRWWGEAAAHAGAIASWAVATTLAAGLLYACIPRKVPTQPPATPAATPAAPAATQTEAPAATPAAAPASSIYSISALARYRLVASPEVFDVPSRLLVVQLYLTTNTGETLRFTPEEVVITLPRGDRARVFDQARATELLERTILAEADPTYLAPGEPRPAGGIDEYNRPQLTESVRQNLLAASSFNAASALNGYIIVDTGEPPTNLDGTAMEVVVHRVEDTTPVRKEFRFVVRTPTPEPH
jgi:hypothetical protein